MATTEVAFLLAEIPARCSSSYSTIEKKGFDMRILVTGGAGYIGSISVKMLLDRGHDVLVIDTLEKGHRVAVDPRAQFIHANISDTAVYADELDTIDAVLHCAGYIDVHESMNNPQKYHFNNFENAQTMLNALLERSATKIVFSSTAAVYGNPASTPIEEEAPIRPINPYGESKLLFEKLLKEYENYGMKSVVFRYFNVAGADLEANLGENHEPETHIIPIFINRLMQGKSIQIFGSDYDTFDGTCVRDYIHVKDLALAHSLALEALGRDEEGGCFNLANSRGFSNFEIARAIAEQLGISEERQAELITLAERREGDPAILVASSKKARARFDWQPVYPDISDMIAHAHSYQLMNRH